MKKNLSTVLSILLILLSTPVCGQTLGLPSRPEEAVSGKEFARSLMKLNLEERDRKIADQILKGNIPGFLRKTVPVKFSREIKGKKYDVTYYVASDYLAVGSGKDYFYTPMAPSTAQSIADSLECILPTQKMVDDIYKNAAIQLVPRPIPSSPAMTTVRVFMQHTDSIKLQLRKYSKKRNSNILLAGHKKDIIVSNLIYERPVKNVVIYGWHKAPDNPIQPVYGGHFADWVDYSHGIRLVKNKIRINGQLFKIRNILSDTMLCQLLSDEGPILKPYYPH